MKPFNLERALAGDPVITRDGQLVQGIHVFSNKLFGIIHDEEDEEETFIFYWDKKGKWIYDHAEENIDRMKLFMASKKKKLWIAVSKTPDSAGNYETSSYATPERLQHCISDYSQVIEIEIEE